MPQDTLGCATQHDLLQSADPMRPHYNEVGAGGVGRISNIRLGSAHSNQHFGLQPVGKGSVFRLV